MPHVKTWNSVEPLHETLNTMKLGNVNTYTTENFIYCYCQVSIRELFHSFSNKNEEIHDHKFWGLVGSSILPVPGNVRAREHEVSRKGDCLENVPLKMNLTFCCGYITCCNSFIIIQHTEPQARLSFLFHFPYFDHFSSKTVFYKGNVHILAATISLPDSFSVKGNNLMPFTWIIVHILGLNTGDRRSHVRAGGISLCPII